MARFTRLRRSFEQVDVCDIATIEQIYLVMVGKYALKCVWSLPTKQALHAEFVGCRALTHPVQALTLNMKKKTRDSI